MAAATAIAPTPLRFEERYKKLEVDQGAGRKFYVKIWHYRNNSSTTSGHETTEAKEKAMRPLIAKVREASRKDLGLKHTPHGSKLVVRKSDAEIEPGGTLYSPSIAFENVDTASIVRTFVGKGTPGDIAGTLRLALRYGLVKPDTASLQKYCDTYLGLDCSGFVGNYLNEALGAGIDVMNTGATSYRGPVGNRRLTIESIRENDTLAWATHEPRRRDRLDRRRLAPAFREQGPGEYHEGDAGRRGRVERRQRAESRHLHGEVGRRARRLQGQAVLRDERHERLHHEPAVRRGAEARKASDEHSR